MKTRQVAFDFGNPLVFGALDLELFRERDFLLLCCQWLWYGYS